MLKLLLITLLLPLLCLANNNKAKNTNDPNLFLKDHLFFCYVTNEPYPNSTKHRFSGGCTLFWRFDRQNSQNIQNLKVNEFTIYNKKGKPVNVEKTFISKRNKTKEDPRTFYSYHYRFKEIITDDHLIIFYPAVHKDLSIKPESVELTAPKIKLTQENFMKNYYPQIEEYRKDKELRRYIDSDFKSKLKVSDIILHKHKDFDLIYINRSEWGNVYCTFSLLFVTKKGKVIINNSNAKYASLQCEEFRVVTKFQFHNNLYYAFSSTSQEHGIIRVDLLEFNKKGIPYKSIPVFR